MRITSVKLEFIQWTPTYKIEYLFLEIAKPMQYMTENTENKPQETLDANMINLEDNLCFCTHQILPWKWIFWVTNIRISNTFYDTFDKIDNFPNFNRGNYAVESIDNSNTKLSFQQKTPEYNAAAKAIFE